MSRRGKPKPVNHCTQLDTIACGFCGEEATASAASIPLCGAHQKLVLEIARDAGVTDGHTRMSGRERQPKPYDRLHRCPHCEKITRGDGPAKRHESACLGVAPAKAKAPPPKPVVAVMVPRSRRKVEPARAVA